MRLSKKYKRKSYDNEKFSKNGNIIIHEENYYDKYARKGSNNKYRKNMKKI